MWVCMGQIVCKYQDVMNVHADDYPRNSLLFHKRLT